MIIFIINRAFFLFIYTLICIFYLKCFVLIVATFILIFQAYIFTILYFPYSSTLSNTLIWIIFILNTELYRISTFIYTLFFICCFYISWIIIRTLFLWCTFIYFIGYCIPKFIFITITSTFIIRCRRMK